MATGRMLDVLVLCKNYSKTFITELFLPHPPLHELTPVALDAPEQDVPNKAMTIQHAALPRRVKAFAVATQTRRSHRAPLAVDTASVPQTEPIACPWLSA